MMMVVVREIILYLMFHSSETRGLCYKIFHTKESKFSFLFVFHFVQLYYFPIHEGKRKVAV